MNGNSLELRQLGLIVILLIVCGCSAPKEKRAQKSQNADEAQKAKSSPQSVVSDRRPPVQVEVGVIWSGASTEEVESRIALPLEEAVKSIDGVQQLRVRITPSECWLTLEFPATDDAKKRIRDIRGNLDTIRALPPSAEAPTIRLLTTSAPVWLVWLADDKETLLSGDQATRLRDEIVRLPYVNDVRYFGAVTHFWEIIIDEDLAKKSGTTETAVRQALNQFERAQPKREPLNSGQLEALEIPAKSNRSVRLRDVALVRRKARNLSPADWNDQPATLLRLTWEPQASSDERRKQHRELTESLPKWLEALQIGGKLSLELDGGVDLHAHLDFPNRTTNEQRKELVARAKSTTAELLAGCEVLWVEEKETVDLRIGSVKQPDKLAAQLLKKLNALPGVAVSVANLRSAPDPILLRVSGPDLDSLEEWSQKLRVSASQLSGVSGVRTFGGDTKSELRIVPRSDKLKELGLTVSELTKLVEPGIGGARRTQIGRHQIEIRSKQVRPRLDLKKLKIALPDGRAIPISEVASAQFQIYTATLLRADQQRCIEIRIHAANAARRQKLPSELKPLLSQTRPAGLGQEFNAQIVE